MNKKNENIKRNEQYWLGLKKEWDIETNQKLHDIDVNFYNGIKKIIKNNFNEQELKNFQKKIEKEINKSGISSGDPTYNFSKDKLIEKLNNQINSLINEYNNNGKITDEKIKYFISNYVKPHPANFEDVSYGYDKPVAWKILYNETELKWSSTCHSRSYQRTVCPFLPKKRGGERLYYNFNDISTMANIEPDLEKREKYKRMTEMWDYDKNKKLHELDPTHPATPKDATIGCNKKIAWIYEYRSPILNKTFSFEWAVSCKDFNTCSPVSSALDLYQGFNDLETMASDSAQPFTDEDELGIKYNFDENKKYRCKIMCKEWNTEINTELYKIDIEFYDNIKSMLKNGFNEQKLNEIWANTSTSIWNSEILNKEIKKELNNCLEKYITSFEKKYKKHFSYNENIKYFINNSIKPHPATPRDIRPGSKIKVYWTFDGFCWSTTASARYSGNTDCPYVNQSKGERIIQETLEKIKNSFNITQNDNFDYMFDTTISAALLSSKEKSDRLTKQNYSNLLIKISKSLNLDKNNTKDLSKKRFDFYINNYLLIEYDGEQHFHSMRFGHDDAKKKFEQTQLYDSLKNEYAKITNRPLLRIPYKYNPDTIKDIVKIQNITKYFIATGCVPEEIIKWYKKNGEKNGKQYALQTEYMNKQMRLKNGRNYIEYIQQSINNNCNKDKEINEFESKSNLEKENYLQDENNKKCILDNLDKINPKTFDFILQLAQDKNFKYLDEKTLLAAMNELSKKFEEKLLNENNTYIEKIVAKTPVIKEIPGKTKEIPGNR